MQFNTKALENKMRYLDTILDNENIINTVLNKNLQGDWQIKKVPRVWEPGGGSTLYQIEYNGKKYFLKIKHRSVTVESKLEEETAYSEIPSLQNEFDIITKLNKQYCPYILFFDEEQEYQFLAFEYVEYSLRDKLEKATVEEILNLWNQLENATKELFQLGVVHCDLHENNIRCREDGTLVIIDFEESRYLKQNTDFKHSLDYVGYNQRSSLGDFPLYKQQSYKTHYNCLLRMREVIKDYLLKKLPEFLTKCNYDSENGICTALDHGKNNKIYQSINTRYLQIKGQRGLVDNRLDILDILVDYLYHDDEFTFIDVGSNNGNFCREVFRHTGGKAGCIGLEGFHDFNILAEALCYLEDYEDIEFLDFVCGIDSLDHLKISKNSLMTICSVYHHIENKDEFIDQIKRADIKYIMFEMATQTECYEGRTWEAEIARIKQKLGFEQQLFLIYSEDYGRPIILLAKKKISKETEKKIRYTVDWYEKKKHIKKRMQGIYNRLKGGGK